MEQKRRLHKNITNARKGLTARSGAFLKHEGLSGLLNFEEEKVLAFSDAGARNTKIDSELSELLMKMKGFYLYSILFKNKIE